MKKTLFLILCSIVVTFAARAEHLDFFGAELNGSHEGFVKLLAENLIVPTADCEENTATSMFFDADFNGQPAVIEVCWTPVSDNVYQATLGFAISEAGAEEDISNACAFIELNYDVAEHTEENGMHTFTIPDKGYIVVFANEGILATSFIDNENFEKYDAEGGE